MLEMVLPSSDMIALPTNNEATASNTVEVMTTSFDMTTQSNWFDSTKLSGFYKFLHVRFHIG